MSIFKRSTLAIAVAIAAAALAGCGPAAPPTDSAGDMLTAVAKGQLAWPGDKVTVVYTSALLRGRQLVLVRGSTTNGTACWLVDPASTVPGAELHRITSRAGCALRGAAGGTAADCAAAPATLYGRQVTSEPACAGVSGRFFDDHAPVILIGRVAQESQQHGGIVFLTVAVNTLQDSSQADVIVPISARDAARLPAVGGRVAVSGYIVDGKVDPARLDRDTR